MHKEVTSLDKRVPVNDSEVRTCKVCNITKILNTEFRYLSYYDCYTHCCKDCYNRRGRLQRAGLPIPIEYDVLTQRVKKRVVFENKPYRKTGFYNRKRIDFKSQDKKKGWISDLTVEFIEKCYNSPCIYCGYPSFTLERVDNSKGHTIANCVPACYECNICRNRTFSFEEMKIIGKVIGEIKLSRENYVASPNIFPRSKNLKYANN